MELSERHREKGTAMTTAQNANAGVITDLSKVTTYEQTAMYLNEDAATAYATKQPRDIEVGDIVYANFGYTMVMPAFGRVVKRTPCTYVIEELPVRYYGVDQYGQQGMALPVLDGDTVSRAHRTPRSNRFSKSGYLSWNGTYANYWDGKAKWFDFMD